MGERAGSSAGGDVGGSVGAAPTSSTSEDQIPVVEGPKDQATQQLNDNGFPDLAIQAFQRTAETVGASVMSRVPGRAAATLINEGYSTKSFYVHAKSCNWGPMAGFVAQLPPFNKKGIGKDMRYNAKEHRSSAAKLSAIQDAAACRRAASGLAQDHDDFIAATQFVRLGLTAEAVRLHLTVDLGTRKYWNETVPGVPGEGESRPPLPHEVVGLAYNEDKTVYAEFLLVLQPKDEASNDGEPTDIWWAYYRNVWLAASDVVVGSKFLPFVMEDADGVPTVTSHYADDYLNLADPAGPAATKLKTPTAAETKALDAWVDGLGLTPRLVEHWHPIRVAQNPYRTYAEGLARNGITGDFDLFSVWHATTPDPTVRLAERDILGPTPEQLEAHPTLARRSTSRPFSRVSGKDLSVHVDNAPWQIIEMIPGFGEIAGLEHEFIGNINPLVQRTGQLLNGFFGTVFVTDQPMDKPGFVSTSKANVAFHSDEGGRPGVSEIEFPIAAFTPKCLLSKQPLFGGPPLTLPAQVLGDARQFVTYLLQLTSHAVTPVAYGWLTHLLTLVDEKQAWCGPVLNRSLPAPDGETPDQTAKRKEKEDARKAYLDRRVKEVGALGGEASMQALRTDVWNIFTGYHIGGDVLTSPSAVAIMKRATEVLAGYVENIQPVYEMLGSILDIPPPPPEPLPPPMRPVRRPVAAEPASTPTAPPTPPPGAKPTPPPGAKPNGGRPRPTATPPAAPPPTPTPPPGAKPKDARPKRSTPPSATP